MVRPRDRKGRFLKSTSKIPGDLFGNTRTPLLIWAEIYTGSSFQEGEGSAPKVTPKLTIPQYETTIEKVQEEQGEILNKGAEDSQDW
jgi:hypothetical protein